MSSELKTIWRHGRVYGFGSILNRLAGLLLIPILLHAVSAEEWGIYALILLTGRLLTVIPAAINDTMSPIYFDRQSDAGRKEVIATTFVIFCVFALAFLILAYPTAVLVGSIVFSTQDYLIVLLLANVGLIFEVLFEIELDYLRARKHSTLFIVASLIRSLTHLGLSIYLVLGLQMGVTGIILGQMVSFIIIALPLAVLVLARTGFRFSAPTAREMLHLALPLIPAWFAKASLELVERYLLNLLASTATMGIYAFASKLVNQLRPIFTKPFADIWGVRLLELGTYSAKHEEFNRVMVYFMALLASAALAVSMFAPELVRILSGEVFWSAATVVPILALSYLIKPCYFHFELVIIQSKQTRYLPFINGATLVVTAAGLWFLIPALGIVGAAAGELLSRAFRLGLVVWAGHRTSSAAARLFPWRSLLLIVVFAITCYGLSLWIVGETVSPAGFAVKIGLISGFVLAAFFSPVFKAEERSRVLRLAGIQVARLASRPAR